MIAGRRFAALVSRQLDLFEADEAELLAACERAERAYDEAARDEAEERYGEYLELVESAAEELAALRDHYAAVLGEREAEAYMRAFGRQVGRRLRRFAAALERL